MDPTEALQQETRERIAAIADSGEDLVIWMESLTCAPPTEQMMRWMSAYADICDRACCFSPECASIRCQFCHKAFTSVPGRHLPRFECMECNTTVRATICEECFVSPTALHDHVKFCLIDDRGMHSVVHRTEGIAPRKTLTMEDLPHVPIDKLPVGASTSCAVCMSDFDDSVPEIQAVAPPGCERQHAFAQPDSQVGQKDTHAYCCRECHFAFLSHNKHDTYCDLRTYCTLCNHERQVRRWGEEFDVEAAELSARGVSVEAVRAHIAELKALHGQPWIRAAIDASFAGMM